VGLTTPDLAPAVLAWGLPRLRDLPWRHTRDPWAILVSEVMLQQTHVARVVPKWHAFLAEFPTPAVCAAAPLGDVLRAWQGLGYPRRAQKLHTAARRVADLGAFPDTLDRLLALPGVGRYTARALLAFAFESDAAVVDTNIARVYARHTGRSLKPSEVQAVADAAMPRGHAWAFNQCLMDLGALLCRPTSPRCEECPLTDGCAWRRGGGNDPAIGSAGVSRPQRRFAGSDREARGAILRAAAAGVAPEDLEQRTGRPRDHAVALASALESEGLLTRRGGAWHLP
jgi:A/G-specific adenine glycosylase